MKVVFRVDASLSRGTGHVIRCTHLANALVALGASCRFIIKHQVGNLADWVRRQGFVVDEIDDVDGKLGFDWRYDATQVGNILSLESIDWLVVDHYDIDHEWEAEIAPIVKKLLVIDDLANRPHVCDALLDGNLGRHELNYRSLAPANCHFMIGRDYLFIDPICSVMEGGEATGTVVFLGGGDNQIEIGWLIPCIAKSRLPLPVRVVLGRNQPNPEDISSLCRQYGFEAFIAPENFKQMCSSAKLAVVNCGLVSYELAVMETPSVCLWVPGIHQQVAEFLHKEGFALAIELEWLKDNAMPDDEIEVLMSTTPKNKFQPRPGQYAVAESMVNLTSVSQ